MILTIELKFPVLPLTTYKALVRWFQSNVVKPTAKYLQKQINQSAHSKQVHATSAGQEREKLSRAGHDQIEFCDWLKCWREIVFSQSQTIPMNEKSIFSFYSHTDHAV